MMRRKNGSRNSMAAEQRGVQAPAFVSRGPRGLPPVGGDRLILTRSLCELRLVIRPNAGSESDALLPTGVFLDSAPYRGAMPDKFAGALQFAARSRGGFLPAGRRFPGNSPVDKP